MPRDTLIGIIGAIASLAGLVATLFPQSTLTISLSAVVMAGMAVYFAKLWWRTRPKRVKRGKLIEQGNKLIRDASQLVVMFGRDLSWANDYQDAILGSHRGCEIYVICQRSPLPEYVHRADVLRKCGATIIETDDDLGIRATLVDANQNGGGHLLIASKDADHESGQHSYRCKLYTHKEDATVIHAFHCLFLKLRAS